MNEKINDRKENGGRVVTDTVFKEGNRRFRVLRFPGTARSSFW
jgi:hypothetical protein